MIEILVIDDAGNRWIYPVPQNQKSGKFIKSMEKYFE